MAVGEYDTDTQRAHSSRCEGEEDGGERMRKMLGGGVTMDKL